MREKWPDKQSRLESDKNGELIFERQDDEYRTVGWIGFNRLLVKLLTSEEKKRNITQIAFDKICEEIALRPENFKKFAEKLLATNSDSEVTTLMMKLSIAIDKRTVEEYIPGYINNGKLHPANCKLNPYFLNALRIDNSDEPVVEQFKKAQSLDRHNEALDFYVCYYSEKIKPGSISSDFAILELIDVHRDMELYIGKEDPDPSKGVYRYDLASLAD